MTHHEYSESESATAAPECAEAARLLTALFDGEANPTEQRSARAFLNAALQSSAPCASPASMTERIHLACRMAPLENSPGAGFNFERSIAERQLEETLFEAAQGCEPQPFIPALKPFFAEVAVPGDLQKKILHATVHATARARQNQILPVMPRFGTWRETARGWLAPPALRWAGGLAVPAMAAFLLIALRTPQEISEPTVPSNVALPNRTTRAPQPSTSTPGASVASKDTTNIFSLSQIAFGETLGAAQSAPAVETAIEMPTARYADWQQMPMPSATASTQRAVEASVKTVVKNSTVPRGVKLRAALWTREATSPRDVVAKFSSRASLHPVSDGEPRRERRATTPSDSPRIIAADFDETLDAVSRAHDDRPEDVGIVVDSYRASLVSDESSDDGDDITDDDLL